MVNYLLKKSYQRKNLKEIKFRDLWNDHGVFTTMWIYDKPPRILFFKSHIDNLIESLKVYKIYERNIKSQILKLINLNIKKNKNYNHLLRVAVKKNIISISIRNKIKTKKNFNLNIINYKRIKPEYKNLKYKIILKHLSKLDPSKSDIALVVNNKILESGTSNLLFVSKNKIYSPVNNFYKGTNIRFLEKKFKIIKKDIFLKNINNFEEIILVGSGKGITSVKQINEINWNKKSDKFYKKLLFIYNREIKTQKSIFKYIILNHSTSFWILSPPNDQYENKSVCLVSLSRIMWSRTAYRAIVWKPLRSMSDLHHRLKKRKNTGSTGN